MKLRTKSTFQRNCNKAFYTRIKNCDDGENICADKQNHEDKTTKTCA